MLAQQQSQPSSPTKNKLVILAVLCLAQFMLILDVAIVNVALPAIQTELKFDPASLQLVVTVYALTFGSLLLFGGRAADVFGRRRLFLIGLSLFTLSALGCALAQSDVTLIAARALQGVGGALTAPAALSLLIMTFPEGNERNKALGIWSAMASSGGAAGLLLGGILTDLASWRWVFFIHIPLGLAVLLISVRTLPQSSRNHLSSIDWLGAITATLGLVSLVYGLSQGGQKGFDDPTVVALLILAVVLLPAFVVIELWVKQPLLPFGIFRSLTLTGANLATLLLSSVVLGVNYFLTLYFQQVLGYNPIETGLAFLPLTIASAVTSGVAARLVGLWQTRWLLTIGMLSLAVGSFLLSQIQSNSNYWTTVLPGVLLVSVGLGFGYTIGTLAATVGVEASIQGAASGVLTTSQQIGGALGLAALTAVASAASRNTTGSRASVLTTGFSLAFIVMGVIGLVAAFVVLVFIRECDCQAELERRQPASLQANLVSSTTQTASCQVAVTRLASGGKQN